MGIVANVNVIVVRVFKVLRVLKDFKVVRDFRVFKDCKYRIIFLFYKKFVSLQLV